MNVVIKRVHCIIILFSIQSQYLRIQAVAKEQMEIYEKYSREMEEKIRRQREEMKKKAQRFLDKLAYQEEKVYA